MAHDRTRPGSVAVQEAKPPHPGRRSIRPEATEFLDRMKGTLPEEITSADLETLNTGLRFFFSKLRLASGYFINQATSSRHGAIVALDAAWRLVALFKQPYPLTSPILHLQGALGSSTEAPSRQCLSNQFAAWP